MSDLPTGTVTFLYTDIEDSTPLWERGPDQMRTALARHDAILRAAIDGHGGHVYKTIGDAFQAAFALPAQALQAALTAQRGLVSEMWPTRTPIRVRMGLHVGVAEAQETDYAPTHTLNRVARIMSAGHGGQILISVEVADLARGTLPAEVVLRDMGQHRMKGLMQLEHLFQVVAPDLPSEFPALKSLNAFPNNLPVQLTSFVGREREIAEVKRLLGAARLLTLTGPGGTGKTRLTLQVAADVLPEFADGAWLIELAPLADPSHIMLALAGVLGLRELPGHPLSVIVTDYLRAKTALLILDNCEHLVEACARLVDDLLRACPRMKVVASSREALGVAGEMAYRIPPLSLPAEGDTAPSEAVRLFVERAVAAQSRFELNDKNTPAVAQICRRLDGIPLAIELAAARVKVFSAEQIAARLDDRFRLLVGGSRTALPRQQTLRALIDWSYDLLPEEERRLLRRVSVFAGGWTFEAVEDVVVDSDVVEPITQLVNKSLIIAEDNSDTGAMRYRLLETIRQYVRDKLFEAGEATAARDQHFAYFAGLAEEAGPKFQGADALIWIERLEPEYDNFRAALEWGEEFHPLEALQMAASLASYWGPRGYSAEGRRWLQAILTRVEALPPAEGDAAVRVQMANANALLGIGQMGILQGDNAAAAEALAKAVAIARTHGDRRSLGLMLGMWSFAAFFLNDPAAWSAAEESAAWLRDTDDKWALGVALSNLAQMEVSRRGDPSRHPYFDEMLHVVREANNPVMTSMMVLGLGMQARLEGAADLARQHLLESARLFRLQKNRHFVAVVESELAHISRQQGDYPAAVEMYRQTIRKWKDLGQRAAVANQLECFAFMARAHGQPRRAARLLGAAEALRELLGAPMMSYEQVEYDTEVATLRGLLDEATLSSVWVEGRSMTLEQAVAYALEM